MDFLKLTPVYDWFKQKSFSQFGEDVVLFNLLRGKKKGFYVEVGAYHPKIFSNTYLFYKLGWTGVCVEPNPEVRWMFGLVRARDTFVNCGVHFKPRVSQKLAGSNYLNFSTRLPPLRKAQRGYLRQNSSSSAPSVFAGNSSTSRHLNYFVFEDGAVNTFDEKMAKENKKVGRKLLEVVKVPVRTLGSILDEYVRKGQRIDFLSVDVEGQDLSVLKSNDWKKYSPKVIVCEDLEFAIEEPKKSLVFKYLVKQGYKLHSVLGPSLVFIKKSAS